MDSLDDETDEQLVLRAQANTYDTRPFETLVRRHQGFVAANCRVISRSDVDADDLAQEVFVKAYFGLARFEHRAQFRTWLRRIKVHHCLNHLRRARAATMVDLDSAGEALSQPATADISLAAADDRQRIVHVLDGMSDTLRVPLLLRDGDGMSYEEIAQHLGLGLSAVKMRIKRGREEFRRRFVEAGA
ncbi:MAG: RNA polymerase sigma factor [Acidobacteria bacterium]|nr:RNA polymerase sigma factor [Acidobacteriota bacterium]